MRPFYFRWSLTLYHVAFSLHTVVARRGLLWPPASRERFGKDNGNRRDPLPTPVHQLAGKFLLIIFSWAVVDGTAAAGLVLVAWNCDAAPEHSLSWEWLSNRWRETSRAPRHSVPLMVLRPSSRPHCRFDTSFILRASHHDEPGRYFGFALVQMYIGGGGEVVRWSREVTGWTRSPRGA